MTGEGARIRGRMKEGANTQLQLAEKRGRLRQMADDLGNGFA